MQSRLGNDVVLSPGALATRPGLRILKLTSSSSWEALGRVVLNVDWQVLRAGSSTSWRIDEVITAQAASGKAPDIVPA